MGSVEFILIRMSPTGSAEFDFLCRVLKCFRSFNPFGKKYNIQRQNDSTDSYQVIASFNPPDSRMQIAYAGFAVSRSFECSLSITVTITFTKHAPEKGRVVSRTKGLHIWLICPCLGILLKYRVRGSFSY